MYEIKPDEPNLVRRLVELSFAENKKIIREVKVEIFYKTGIGFSDTLPIRGCTTAECDSVSEDTMLPDNIQDFYFDYTILNWSDDNKSQFETDIKTQGLDFLLKNGWSKDYDRFYIDVPFIVNMVDGKGNVALAPPPDYPDPDIDIKNWQKFVGEDIDKLE